MNKKNCIYCFSKFVKKNGHYRGKQRYKCYTCHRQFNGGNRIDKERLWAEYVYGKQTYSQLGKQYSVSARTIQRYLDQYKGKDSVAGDCFSDVIVLMDTTYFGRTFGIMVFKDSVSGKILYKQYVKTETIHLYLHGLFIIASKGYRIKAVVCDGRKGLIQNIKNIPVQMCQFHQVQIITRYITRNPRMPAAKEFKAHIHLLPLTDKESFIGGLQSWYIKWETFLNERSINPLTGKSGYTHRRLRSAYRSVTTNLFWLFTWYDHYELHIPNTTNLLEGTFTDLKNKLRNHNGLSIERKKKFVDEFMQA